MFKIQICEVNGLEGSHFSIYNNDEIIGLFGDSNVDFTDINSVTEWIKSVSNTIFINTAISLFKNDKLDINQEINRNIDELCELLSFEDENGKDNFKKGIFNYVLHLKGENNE